MPNVKNFTEQGGEKTVVGGELSIATGGKITANGTQADAIAKPTSGVDAEVKTAIDAIIDALIGSGIIAAE